MTSHPASARPTVIDPRGARFTATVTAALLLATVAAGLVDGVPPTLAGVALHLAGAPFGLVGAAAAAFVAAFLNAAFGYCLGCKLYLLLVRAGLIRKRAAAV